MLTGGTGGYSPLKGRCGGLVYQGKKADVPAAWLRRGVMLTGGPLQEHWCFVTGESTGGLGFRALTRWSWSQQSDPHLLPEDFSAVVSCPCSVGSQVLPPPVTPACPRCRACILLGTCTGR